MAIINFLLLKESKDLPRKVVQVEAFVEHMKLITGIDISTFFIYHDGRIEKHIASSPKEKNKYRYVYIDKKSQQHEICVSSYCTTKDKECRT